MPWGGGRTEPLPRTISDEWAAVVLDSSLGSESIPKTQINLSLTSPRLKFHVQQEACVAFGRWGTILFMLTTAVAAVLAAVDATVHHHVSLLDLVVLGGAALV